MLRICLVCDEYPPAVHGGIGAFSRDLAEGLALEGAHVTVVGMYKPEMPHATAGECITVNGVRVVRLPCTSRRGTPRLNSFQNRWRLLKWLSAEHAANGIDVLECPDYAGWLPLGGPRGVPTIARLHGSAVFYDGELGRRPARLQQQFERRWLRRAKHLIAVSDYVGRTSIRLCDLQQRSYSVIHNAVDTDRFSPGSEEATRKGMVLFVNTVAQKKGIEELVLAMNVLSRKRPDAYLVVAGKSLSQRGGRNYQEHVLSLAAPLVREKIRFTGHLQREDVVRLLREAEVCCYPSHVEAFGIAPVEAMAVGKPTIFTKYGAGPEVIDDGVSGLLCDPRDSVDIANKIDTILSDVALARRLGAAARDTVLSRFSRTAWIDRNVAAYRQCLGGEGFMRPDRGGIRGSEK